MIYITELKGTIARCAKAARLDSTLGRYVRNPKNLHLHIHIGIPIYFRRRLQGSFQPKAFQLIDDLLTKLLRWYDVLSHPVPHFVQLVEIALKRRYQRSQVIQSVGSPPKGKRISVPGAPRKIDQDTPLVFVELYGVDGYVILNGKCN